jgi:hypothetical protein
MAETREYRKTATVHARKVEDHEEAVQVYSLEGPAIAHPGDYIVTANTDKGETWVVEGAVFESTYEPL